MIALILINLALPAVAAVVMIADRFEARRLHRTRVEQGYWQ